MERINVINQCSPFVPAMKLKTGCSPGHFLQSPAWIVQDSICGDGVLQSEIRGALVSFF